MKYKALVIGVSDYLKLEKLTFCQHDGNSLYDKLTSLGYDIPHSRKLVGKVRWTFMRKAILDFFDNPSVLPDDTLVFYYSGHAVHDMHGDFYLSTSEIDPESPHREGFAFSELTKMVQISHALKVILILDCCFSGSAKIGEARGYDAARLGSATIDTKFGSIPDGEGRCILAACEPYGEASALENYSTYTYYLLRGLGNITVDTLSSYIDKKVKNLPSRKRLAQRPMRKIESFGDMIVVDRTVFSQRNLGYPTETELKRESGEETQYTDEAILKGSSVAEVRRLITRGKEATKHPAKLHVFSTFVENVYGIEVGLIPGIEKKVGSQVYGMKGSIDLLFSHVILEFKIDFNNEIDDGKSKLIKYFQLLYEDDPESKYVGIVTDCIKYSTFVPEITNGKVTSLNPLDTIKDISLMDPKEVILWIDSFLFSKSDKPTALDLTVRFGPGSPTHRFAIKELASLQKIVESEKEVQLKMDLWSKNMKIVYGSQPIIEAFIDHTYLVTIVKILVYLRLSETRTMSSIDIKGILTGKYFGSHGILNLIEEDYFSWILDPKIISRSIQLGMVLAGELMRYDLSQVEEDLFKEIYQTIVKQGERHKIGEYYTPEWVSEISLREAISTWRKEHSGSNNIPKILDPACGSGTFMTNAISLIRSELSVSKSDILNTILSHVIGMDVNPLAVIIARANYIITLGDLVRLGKPVFIPIFLSDSVKIPEVTQTVIGDIEVIPIPANGTYLELPLTFATDGAKRNASLTALRAAVSEYQERKNREYALGIFENKAKDILSCTEIEVMKLTMNTLLSMIDKDQDSIWIFIMNNMYAPVLLSNSKVDLVVGNPPWIVMRSMETSYQKFLKEGVFEYDLLKKTDTHLFTHVEMATYFFMRCADLYLETGGLISFILPISVLGPAGQHKGFQRFSKPLLHITHIFNFEEISGIFSLPFCVMFGIKGKHTQYPVREVRFFW